MTIKEIIVYPDPRLEEKCQEVTEFNEELVILLEDMAETMYAAQGIGLAAPQIGILERITVIDVSPEQNSLLYLINPKIVSRVGTVTTEEGCLSIPEYREKVTRSAEIEVEAQNEKGELITFPADELLSVCVQHEIDHLDGILFIERISRLKRNLFKRWFKKQLAARSNMS